MQWKIPQSHNQELDKEKNLHLQNVIPVFCGIRKFSPASDAALKICWFFVKISITYLLGIEKKEEREREREKQRERDKPQLIPWHELKSRDGHLTGWDTQTPPALKITWSTRYKDREWLFPLETFGRLHIKVLNYSLTPFPQKNRIPIPLSLDLAT